MVQFTRFRYKLGSKWPPPFIWTQLISFFTTSLFCNSSHCIVVMVLDFTNCFEDFTFLSLIMFGNCLLKGIFKPIWFIRMFYFPSSAILVELRISHWNFPGLFLIFDLFNSLFKSGLFHIHHLLCLFWLQRRSFLQLENYSVFFHNIIW